MFTSKMLTSSLLLFCSFLPLVFSCSCVSYTRSRSLAICNDYSSESSIYKARITASQCKCNLDSSTDRFSCIDTRQYSNGSLAGSVQGLYECGNSSSSTFPYSSCRNVINSLGISNSSITNNTVSVENVTCDENAPYIADEGGCAVSLQPCYYTVIVEAVYKGNIQVGQVMNTSGPDVLTTCGQYGLILTVGESYIVGIGGPCSVLNDWSSFNSYSSSEIELLESGSCNMKEIIIGVSVSISLFLLITIASIIFIIIVIVIATRKKRRPIHRGIIKEVDMKNDDNNDEVGSDEKAIIVNDS